MTSSSKSVIEIGSWTDIINLSIVCITLIVNGIKNRAATKENREQQLKFFKLKTKAAWFERIILRNLQTYDRFFIDIKELYLSIDIKNRKSKILARKNYQVIRERVRDEILPLKAFDEKLFVEITHIFEGLENKLFSNENIKIEELNEYHVFFTMALINYEKNEYEII
ncbi:MAG: hypothetical protein ACRC1R_00670 [Cetobacterium sp.]|uniref:hypothetical protein n=1 Tax=Cetobacterium sp. TaxID=2071632 RepID=UPI003F31A341